jgi:hypothetical protein
VERGGPTGSLVAEKWELSRRATGGVFQLGQVGGSLERYCYYCKGWFGLVGVERVANSALPLDENIGVSRAEISAGNN